MMPLTIYIIFLISVFIATMIVYGPIKFDYINVWRVTTDSKFNSIRRYTVRFIQGVPKVGDIIIVNDVRKDITFVEPDGSTLLRKYWVIYWNKDRTTKDPEITEESKAA